MATLNVSFGLGFSKQFNEDSRILKIPQNKELLRNPAVYTTKCKLDLLPSVQHSADEMSRSYDNSFFSANNFPWSSSDMIKNYFPCNGIDSSCSYSKQLPFKQETSNGLHFPCEFDKLLSVYQSSSEVTVSPDVESLSDSTFLQSPTERVCDGARSSETTTVMSNFDDASDPVLNNVYYATTSNDLFSSVKNRRLEIFNRLGYWINWSLEMQSICSQVYKWLLDEFEGEEAPYLDPMERKCIQAFLLDEVSRCSNTSPLNCVDLRSKIQNSFLNVDSSKLPSISGMTIDRLGTHAKNSNIIYNVDDVASIEANASKTEVCRINGTKQLSKVNHDNDRKSLDEKCNSSNASTISSQEISQSSPNGNLSKMVPTSLRGNTSLKRPTWSFPKEWSDYDFTYARSISKVSQLKFLASANVVGKLFDYNGENIRMLQSRFKVRISTSGNRVFYPGTGKQVLLIKGQLTDILYALRTVFIMMVPDILEVDSKTINFDPSIIRFELSIVIPSTTSNKILSSKGTQIQWIQKRTNARIHVTCMRFELGDVQERLMTINGLQTEVEQTVELVSMVIQEDINGDAYSFLNYPLYTKAHMN